MLMSGLIFVFALLLGPFVINQLMEWAMNLRLARQEPPVQEEATTEEMVEKSTEEANDSSKDDSVSVTLLDPELFECPICCEPLTIPIFQCTNGHIVCSICSKKIRYICPSCRLPIGFNRCRAMERVIETSRVSCPNAKYGCKESVSYENLSNHEKQCVFVPCSCPVRDCNYTGSHKSLKNHVTVKHKKGLVRFTWDTPFNDKLIDKITIFREEKDGELIVLQGFKGQDGVLISVSAIAPLATEVGIFSCSLEIKSLTNTLKHRLIIKNVQEMSEECPKEDFMLIPSYMLRRARTMKICINRCNVHIT